MTPDPFPQDRRDEARRRCDLMPAFSGNDIADMMPDALAQLDLYEARIRELEADARRYRWLREHYTSWIGKEHTGDRIRTDDLTREWLCVESLDAAIDAALQRGLEADRA